MRGCGIPVFYELDVIQLVQSSVLPYCAKVFRSVEDRGLDLTHGGIIRLDAELIQKATSERFSKQKSVVCFQQNDMVHEGRLI
jgi:hypothetical protein